MINSKTSQPEPDYFGSFSGAFRKKAHTLIYWGYKGALSRIKCDSDEEPTITGYIYESIRNSFRALNCPGWCEDYSVMENPPEEGYEGKKRPLPDLVIEGTMKRRPEYVFEAKRLKKNGFPVGEYLGQEGLGCFLSGKYAKRYDEAVMLGYVQSDSPADWKRKLQKQIIQKKESLTILSLPEKVEVIDDFPDEWMTKHGRNVIGRPISIYHILLDFTRYTG